jgi:DNA-directed RNA polymerase subunit omega
LNYNIKYNLLKKYTNIMARVTVEDCLEKVDNRFDLVAIAAKRAHQLNTGSHTSLIDGNGDKSSVIALREIAEGLIDKSILGVSTSFATSTTNMEEVDAEFAETKIDSETDELSEVVEEA